MREVYVERVGDLKLLVGGKHGYVRVRGGQGPDKDKYQGYTVDKKNTTASFKTAREAAIALAELERGSPRGLAGELGGRLRRQAAPCARLARRQSQERVEEVRRLLRQPGQEAAHRCPTSMRWSLASAISANRNEHVSNRLETYHVGRFFS